MASRKRIKSSTPGSVGGGDIIIIGGSAGLEISSGSQTERMGLSIATTQATGTDTEAMGPLNAQATLPHGSQTETMTFANADTTMATGSDTQRQDLLIATTLEQGSETESMDGLIGMQSTIPIGTDTESDVGSLTGTVDFPQGTDAQDMAGADVTLPNPSTVMDSSGNGNHGTIVGAPVSVTSPWANFVRAFDFDGAADSIEHDNPFSYQTGSVHFAIEARVRISTNTGTTRVIASRWRSTPTTAENWLLFVDTSNRVVFRIRNSTPGNTDVTSGVLAAGDYVIAATYKTTATAGMRLFVDGTLVAGPTTTTFAAVDAGVPFVVGALAGSGSARASFYNDIIDEVRISLGDFRHDSTYTPDSSPFTTDGSTSLLWHLDDTGGTFPTELNASGSTPHGSHQHSFEASATLDASDHTNTATAVTADTPAWTSPTNAQGAFNGTEASVANPTGLDTAQDATLRCAGLVVPTTPSGFTAGDVFIHLRHRYDFTITGAIAGVLDVTTQLILLDSADVPIATIGGGTASGGLGTQTTLITDIFNITSLVSEAQLTAGVKIDARVFTTGAFVSAVNGNYSWQVDGCHLVRSYTRTGIS